MTRTESAIAGSELRTNLGLLCLMLTIWAEAPCQHTHTPSQHTCHEKGRSSVHVTRTFHPASTNASAVVRLQDALLCSLSNGATLRDTRARTHTQLW